MINHRKLAVALVCGLAFWVLASPTVHADATMISVSVGLDRTGLG